MPEVNFKSLQSTHESLLQKQQKVTEKTQGDFASEVMTYIEQAKQAGSNIASTRERDQVRANLRYWANYIYSIEKTFPDTELAPSTTARPKPGPALRIAAGVVVGLICLVAGGSYFSSQLFGGGVGPTEPPIVPTTATPPATATPIIGPTLEKTATLESTGFNVILSSPANGDFITPNIEFKGTFDNLKPGWAIHVLFIKGDKYFPIKENYPIPETPASNEWMIQTQLTESPEEMSQAQSYSVVLVVSINDSTRELLSNSSETGIEIDSLPDTVLPFDDTARVIYRDPFTVIRETMLLYSFHTGISYDVFYSKPDGSEEKQSLTSTKDVSERDPQLSPDGKRIAYVKYFITTDTYAISIMDSNGENDHEIINAGKNVLESPQWSPDSSYISYTVGETRPPSNTTYWSIHTYQLSTEEDREISEVPGRDIINRYHCWIPETNLLVFNTDTSGTGASSLVQVSMDSLDSSSGFFDTAQQEIQLNIYSQGNGYFLIYAIVDFDRNYVHDIYAVIVSDKETPLDGSPIRLIESGGEAVDFPILDPTLDVFYYIKNGEIIRVEFQVEGDMITLVREASTSAIGRAVGATGATLENLGFDVGYMDAFFPIK